MGPCLGQRDSQTEAGPPQLPGTSQLPVRRVRLAEVAYAVGATRDDAIANTLAMAVGTGNLVSRRHRFLSSRDVGTLVGPRAEAVVLIWLTAREKGRAQLSEPSRPRYDTSRSPSASVRMCPRGSVWRTWRVRRSATAAAVGRAGGGWTSRIGAATVFGLPAALTPRPGLGSDHHGT